MALGACPDPQNPLSKEGLTFGLIYLGIFVGAALYGSGAELKARIRRIKREIEDQLIKESIAGTSKRSRTQIEDAIEIPSGSIWKQWHELYLAPIITAIVGALILKFVFGI